MGMAARHPWAKSVCCFNLFRESAMLSDLRLMASAAFGVLLAAALPAPAFANPAEPVYSDTAGTVFDIIQTSDPTTFRCLDPMGQEPRQIWDKRVDGEPIVNAYLFMARFSDGTSIEIAINPEFATAEAAQTEAMRYTVPLGQLPTSLRAGIARFSVHKGRKGYHAGTGQIVVYAETTDNRLSYRHLEESLFHESVHASWDAHHRLAPGWIAAQTADGGFLTDYGRETPDREDLAETALFAFAILHHPERFPPADTEDTLAAVPNRIAYIKALLPPGVPLVTQIGPPAGCAANGG
jgi:hypothetical protein